MVNHSKNDYIKLSKRKTSVAVFLLFIVIMLPIWKLSEKLQDTRSETSEWVKLEAKAILSGKIYDFQQNLIPKGFLQKFVEDKLDKKQKHPNT